MEKKSGKKLPQGRISIEKKICILKKKNTIQKNKNWMINDYSSEWMMNGKIFEKFWHWWLVILTDKICVCLCVLFAFVSAKNQRKKMNKIMIQP